MTVKLPIEVGVYRVTEQASESQIAISDDELARVIEYTAYLDELNHPQVLLDGISLLIRAIYSLKPDLQHSSDWIGSEDVEIQASSRKLLRVSSVCTS